MTMNLGYMASLPQAFSGQRIDRASAEDEAAALLGSVRAEDGSLVLPVDPGAVATSLGVSVHEADLPDEVSGALMRLDSLKTVILLNDSDAPVRKRFTCAHELGHFVERANEQGSEGELRYIDYRDSRSSKGEDSHEVFANRFAASLLMPPEEVTEFCESLSIVEMALKFGVSVEAMTYRLKNLGLFVAR